MNAEDDRRSKSCLNICYQDLARRGEKAGPLTACCAAVVGSASVHRESASGKPDKGGSVICQLPAL